MKQIMKQVGMMVACVFALGLPDDGRAADANPPERMTYQGYLVDGNGAPLGNSAPTNYDVVFRVYADKQAGTALWAEQQTITVDKGYFSVLLGEGSSTASGEPGGNLSAAFDGLDASDRFIGITVETGSGATEIAPRLRLVASPYAYTATQARRLTDGSGNANFYKDGTTLKLGVGSTPTLTLTEAGNATLTGKLTADMPDWGVGLQVDNGAVSTTFGAESSSVFHFNTELPGFYFNKKLVVNGDILSSQRDSILGSDNNTDTYLRVKSASDVIDANADEFWVRGDSNYLQTKFTSNKVELHTDAGSVYLNKPLSVGGGVTAAGQTISATAPTIKFEDTDEDDYWIHANQNRLYVLHGEGSWNGNRPLTILDGNKVGINAPTPVQALNVGGNIAVSGSLLVDGDRGLRNVTGQFGTVQTTGNGGSNWEGYSIDGRYVFMSADNDNVGIYNDVDNTWVTNYSKTAVSGGRYAVYLNGGSVVLSLRHSNGSRYASYDGDQSWDFYSDRRLKENIVKEDNMLDRIMQLDVVNYDFIDEKKKEHKEFGFIAQEVEPLFPSLVSEQDDDRYDFKVKSIGYSSFGVVALGGIKELKLQTDAEIASLKQEVETLKSEMVVLKASLAANKTSETRLAKLEELVAKLGE